MKNKMFGRKNRVIAETVETPAAEPQTIEPGDVGEMPAEVTQAEPTAEPSSEPATEQAVVVEPAKKGYVRLDPAEAKRRRIEAAHKRWRTIKANRARRALLNS